MSFFRHISPPDDDHRVEKRAFLLLELRYRHPISHPLRRILLGLRSRFQHLIARTDPTAPLHPLRRHALGRKLIAVPL